MAGNDGFDLVSYEMGRLDAGGGGDVTVESKSIGANGTYTAPTGKAYSPVNVSVPNSYAAGDEGKVVSNGALVAQTAHAEVTSNGTIDTTLNNSVVVNVSGGSSPWTKLAEQDFTVNTSSTTQTEIGTISCGSAAWTSAKMLYVRVRDKAGARSGYYYGSDCFTINSLPANELPGPHISFSNTYTKRGTSSWSTTVGSNGLYPTKITNTGDITVATKYHATAGTIDGTYHIEVYTLDWPDGASPFATS